MSQNSDRFEPIGFPLAVLAGKDIQPVAAFELPAQVAEISGFDRFQKHSGDFTIALRSARSGINVVSLNPASDPTGEKRQKIFICRNRNANGSVL